MVVGTATLQPLHELAQEMRAECTGFEQVVAGMFDQLDGLRAELDRRAVELQAAEERLARRERELSEQHTVTSRITEQFDQQDHRLTKTLEELEEIKGWVRETMGQVSAVATSSSDTEESEEDAQRMNELEQERVALEAELELVRGRAAELHESLSQERRTTAEQRHEMSQELKQLRRIVEKQAELLQERPLAVSPVAHEAPVPVSEEPALDSSGADPVISSVMAQFAKLQKEVAERRKQRKQK